MMKQHEAVLKATHAAALKEANSDEWITAQTHACTDLRTESPVSWCMIWLIRRQSHQFIMCASHVLKHIYNPCRLVFIHTNVYVYIYIYYRDIWQKHWSWCACVWLLFVQRAVDGSIWQRFPLNFVRVKLAPALCLSTIPYVWWNDCIVFTSPLEDHKILWE